MLLFGVEIEACSSLRSKIDYNTSLQLRTPKFWKIKDDPTIIPAGLELVSPTFEWDELSSVFEVVEILQKLEFKTNQSCGLHIHMSGEFPTWDSIRQTVERWYEKLKPGFRPAKVRRKSYCIEQLEHEFPYQKYQIVRLVDEKNNRAHIEVRLYNAHLCKRWVARCLYATKELGDLLECNQSQRVCNFV